MYKKSLVYLKVFITMYMYISLCIINNYLSIAWTRVSLNRQYLVIEPRFTFARESPLNSGNSDKLGPETEIP